MWSNGVGKIGKPMKDVMNNVLNRHVSWLGLNITGEVREAGKLLVWEIVVSIFEMNQNWS